MARVFGIILSFVCISTLPARQIRAAEPVVVHVRNPVANAPATVYVTITVMPNAQNRRVVVEIDSGEYLRSTLIELDGHTDAPQSEVAFRSIPAGDYAVTARLFGDNGVVATATETAIVLGGGRPATTSALIP